jgi:hypothetical protein
MGIATGGGVRRRSIVSMALAALVATGGIAAPRVDAAPPTGEQPFPTDKSATLRGGPYVIDGAKTIPRGVEINVAPGVRISGKNHASLDVQGGLKITGTTGDKYWVRVDDVDFSPTKTPALGVHFDMADFSRCKIAHPLEGTGFEGEWTIENCTFQRDCGPIDVKMTKGFLKLMTVEFGIGCKIRCEPPKGSPKGIELQIRTAWMREFAIEGPATAHVVHSNFPEGFEAKRVTDLDVNGCDVRKTFHVAQAADDSFRGVSLTKVNLFEGATVVLERAAGGAAKPENVTLQKFWFDDSPQDLSPLVKDGGDAGTVKALIQQRSADRHYLVTRMVLGNIPPLR